MKAVFLRAEIRQYYRISRRKERERVQKYQIEITMKMNDFFQSSDNRKQHSHNDCLKIFLTLINLQKIKLKWRKLFTDYSSRIEIEVVIQTQKMFYNSCIYCFFAYEIKHLLFVSEFETKFSLDEIM